MFQKLQEADPGHSAVFIGEMERNILLFYSILNLHSQASKLYSLLSTGFNNISYFLAVDLIVFCSGLSVCSLSSRKKK